MDFGDYSFTPNRRVSALGNAEDDFQIYKGPGLNKIPGRIQTLNPYNRDDISSATFSKDTLGKCFTYVTKTMANLTTFSRKPGNYNGTIIFEIDIMKKSYPIN